MTWLLQSILLVITITITVITLTYFIVESFPYCLGMIQHQKLTWTIAAMPKTCH